LREDHLRSAIRPAKSSVRMSSCLCPRRTGKSMTHTCSVT
jgi:hypothetical protein